MNEGLGELRVSQTLFYAFFGEEVLHMRQKEMDIYNTIWGVF